MYCLYQLDRIFFISFIISMTRYVWDLLLTMTPAARSYWSNSFLRGVVLKF